MSVPQTRSLYSPLFSLLCCLAVLGVVCGPLKLAGDKGMTIVPAWLYLGAAAAAALVLLLRETGKVFALPRRWQSAAGVSMLPHVFTCGVALLWLSDFVQRRYIFYTDSSRRDLLLWALAACAAAVWLQRRRFSLFSPQGLVIVQALLAVVFLRYAEGRLIYSDDHPSFLYRLQLLKEQFPWIPFYNPEWNGGAVAKLLSTGVLSVFFLSWPLLGGIETLAGASRYTLLIPYLFVLVAPWTVYAAVLLSGGEKKAASIAAFFALGPSLYFFEWLLKYGTVPFSLSSALICLALALTARTFCTKESPGWPETLSLLVVSYLVLAWPLAFIFFLPAAVFALFNVRHLFARERLPKLAAFFLLFALLNAPWILLFVRETPLAQFVQRDTLPGTAAALDGAHMAAQTPDEGLADKGSTAYRRFKESAVQLNPLILCFFLPGIALVKRREVRRVYGWTCFWLLAVSAAGTVMKPQLELKRMIIPASFLLCVFAGLAIERAADVFGEKLAQGRLSNRILGWAGLSLIAAAMLVSPLNIAAIYSNRSDQKYGFASSGVGDLVQAIQQHGGSGRTFFLGFVLHEFNSTGSHAKDGGHIAPLAKFTGKPLYASHYYHTAWGAVDPIPESFRARDEQGVEEFLDLVNATSVVTFNGRWADYCLENPKYKLVYTGERTWMFSRQGPAQGYFLEGDGEIVSVSEDKLEIRPRTKESVVKFRYFPRLLVSPAGAAIEGQEAFLEDGEGGKKQPVEYIKLKVDDEALRRQQAFAVGYHSQ